MYSMTWITRTSTSKTTESFSHLSADALRELSRSLTDNGKTVATETYKLIPLKD